MANPKYSANLEKLLLHCMTQPDPMLSMLEWLCEKLMEAEVSQQVGADKHEQSGERHTYRSGYRPRRFDTCMGSKHLPNGAQGAQWRLYTVLRPNGSAVKRL